MGRGFGTGFTKTFARSHLAAGVVFCCAGLLAAAALAADRGGGRSLFEFSTTRPAGESSAATAPAKAPVQAPLANSKSTIARQPATQPVVSSLPKAAVSPRRLNASSQPAQASVATLTARAAASATTKPFRSASAAIVMPTTAPAGVAGGPILSPAGEGAGFVQAKCISDGHFSITLSGMPMFFLFKLENVKGRVIQIDLHKMDAGFWRTFCPVYTVAADMADPATFTAAPDRVTDPRRLSAALNGPLLPDPSGQKWTFISAVTVDQKSNTISFSQKFDQPTVWVAMRYPYTPALAEHFAADLQEAIRSHKVSGVEVVAVGKTPRGRPLQLIKFAAGAPEAQKYKPCVLIYAREHACEPDGSWVAQGAVDYLLSSNPELTALREKFIFLIIPMLDPDGAAANAYEHLTHSFEFNSPTPESLAWAGFFQKWVADGNRLDVAINLHNVQSAEGPHIWEPQLEVLPSFAAAAKGMEPYVMGGFERDGFEVRRATFHGDSPERLAGFLETYYGTLHQPYEINVQGPNRHLSLYQVRMMGRNMVRGTAGFLSSDAGVLLMAENGARRTMRNASALRYASYFASKNVFEQELWFQVMPGLENGWRKNDKHFSAPYEALEKLPMPMALKNAKDYSNH